MTMQEKGKPGGPEKFTPDEEMAAGAPATPEDEVGEKGEGDEWIHTGKSSDEQKESQE